MPNGPGDFFEKARLGQVARSHVEAGHNGPSSP